MPQFHRHSGVEFVKWGRSGSQSHLVCLTRGQDARVVWIGELPKRQDQLDPLARFHHRANSVNGRAIRGDGDTVDVTAIRSAAAIVLETPSALPGPSSRHKLDDVVVQGPAGGSLRRSQLHVRLRAA
eukprot:1962353-Rhodomonas_salina.4